MRYMSKHISEVLNRTIREEQGLVYSIDAIGYGTLLAEQHYTLKIQFACAPDKVDNILQQVRTMLQTGADTDTLSQATLDSWIAADRLEYTSKLPQAKIRLAELVNAELQGYSLSAIGNTTQRIPDLPVQSIQHALAAFTSEKARRGVYILRP